MRTYKDGCVTVLNACENILGVYELIDGESLESAPIKEFYKEYRGHKKSKDALRKMCASCGYHMASLSYTKDVCKFNRISVLDFSEHRRLDLLCNLLIPFQRREDITKLAERSLVSIVEYLYILENKDKRFINSLSYRYIRLFLIYAMIGNYSHCGVVADFLLNQIFMSENLDNSIKQKVEELLYANKRLKEISDKYTPSSTIPGKILDKTTDIAKTSGKKLKRVCTKIEEYNKEKFGIEKGSNEDVKNDNQKEDIEDSGSNNKEKDNKEKDNKEKDKMKSNSFNTVLDADYKTDTTDDSDDIVDAEYVEDDEDIFMSVSSTFNDKGDKNE